MRNKLSNNLGLKIVALILAFITWIYINGELKRNRVKTETSQTKNSQFNPKFYPAHYA